MTIWNRILEYATSTDPDLPPHAIMAERAVLAAWLERGQRPAIAARLVADDLSYPWHRELFSYLAELNDLGRPCDLYGVSDHMLSRGIADSDRFVDLLDLVNHASTTTAADPGWCLDGILAAARQREEIALGQRLAQRPTEASVAHAEYSERVAAIDRRAQPARQPSFRDHVNRAVTRYSTGLQPGIPTGLRDYDLITEGLRPGGVTIVAARPGVGKSLLVTTVAANICTRGNERVGFVSLEMSAEEVQDRLIAGETGIGVRRLRRGGDELTQDDWLAIDEARERIDDWPLDIAARAHDQADLRAYAERLATQAPRTVLIVDYLQRIREAPGVSSRERHVSQVSNTLKDIAVDLDVAVLAVASMSRESERRGGRPKMSDLRDSGTIESDADVVLLLWQEDPDVDCNIVDGVVDKNRHGPLGQTQFVRRGEVGRVDNLSRAGSFQ